MKEEQKESDIDVEEANRVLKLLHKWYNTIKSIINDNKNIYFTSLNINLNAELAKHTQILLYPNDKYNRIEQYDLKEFINSHTSVVDKVTGINYPERVKIFKESWVNSIVHLTYTITRQAFAESPQVVWGRLERHKEEIYPIHIYLDSIPVYTGDNELVDQKLSEYFETSSVSPFKDEDMEKIFSLLKVLI